MTGKAGASGASVKEERNAGRRAGRALAVFKALVLLVLLAVTTYGMIRNGLYQERLWLPVAAGILGLLLVSLFVRGFYRDVPGVGWILLGLLAALVAVKGISMVWTISEILTVRELLRSSMYLAAFLMALAALSSIRQAAPLVDISVLISAAVAGYGLLQKLYPLQYPVDSISGVRVDSTLGYANTAALVIGMGIVLALARLSRMENAMLRGVYAALTLGLAVALYLTVSRGGIISLVVGVVVLLALTSGRLQMLANLILLGAPAGWLVWRIQSLDGLFRAGIPDAQKVADGVVFRNDLLLALVAAFVLQALYSLVANRFGLTGLGRRVAGGAALGGAALVLVVGGLVLADRYGGVGEAYRTLLDNPNSTADVSQRLASLSIGKRTAYWEVAWEEWKEHPLTGTGAGTFQYTWTQDRPGTSGVNQVHNLYLEQGTETGVVAFLAIVGFTALLVAYTVWAALRSPPATDRRLLLSGLSAAVVVYLFSSIAEWHWYVPASTLFFFILAATTIKLAAVADEETPGPDDGDG